ncbi:MAG: hypothetical protein EU547_01110, partial [Promethearchaeota archaeon]
MSIKTMKFNLGVFIFLAILSITLLLPIYSVMATSNFGSVSTLKTATINESWGPIQLVSAGSINDSNNPALASDDLNNTFIVWDEYNQTLIGEDYDVKLRKYNGNSGLWDEIEVISDDLNERSQYPDISVDSNDQPTVVWQDTSDNDTSYNSPTIFYSSQNSGGTWTKPQNITHTNSSPQKYPSLSYEGTTAHLIWTQENRTNSNNYHINYSTNFLPG